MAWTLQIIHITLLISFLFTYTLQTTPTDNYYIGAVVEYNAVNNLPSAKENAIANAKRMAAIINKTGQYFADIIVFPELGILAYDHSYYFKVPEPRDKAIPATTAGYDEVLKILSQAAIDQKIYVVVNLHEIFNKNGTDFKYNTNVVFDRSGTVIARYRKYNLFGEIYLNRPSKPEFVYFETDFGVKFGTFICFDIVFENPAVGLVRDYNITDIIFPTAWFHELPFHIGIQEQYTWSYANDVNLLASGYLNVSMGNTGSGIYAGKLGSIVYIESETNGTKILVGNVPKKSIKQDTAIKRGSIISFEDNVPVPKERILHEDLTLFTTKLITPETMAPIKTELTMLTETKVRGIKKRFILAENICNGLFCCNFNLTFNVDYFEEKYNFSNDISYNKADSFYHYNYRLIAFDGIRKYSVIDTSGQQLCALMPCLNNDLESCAKISNQLDIKNLNYINDKELGKLFRYSTNFESININGEFHNHRVLILPSMLASSDATSNNNTFGKLIEPNQFKLDIKNTTDKYKVNLAINATKFVTGGIFVRLFERDNHAPNGVAIFTPSSLLCYFVAVLIYFISLK